MDNKIKGITISIDSKITIDNINDYNECLNCGSHKHIRFYLDNGIIISKCEECGFRVEGYGAPPDETTDNKQLDAIYNYIQQLELCLIGVGGQLPSNREDVDWKLFK